MELTFEDFKKRALNNKLSPHEKVGFPDSYREGHEDKILNDIVTKVNLERGKKILDIGCGCSKLTFLLYKFCQENELTLFLNDSEEMLSQLSFPSNLNIHFIPGKFPDILNKNPIKEKFDVILVYSVIQYVFYEGALYSFIHACLSLLKSGGVILIGDIP